MRINQKKGEKAHHTVEGHWTDIPTEIMATSTICNQDSVRICSLAVNINNTDESFFFTVGVLKLLTFSLHKMLEM